MVLLEKDELEERGGSVAEGFELSGLGAPPQSSSLVSQSLTPNWSKTRASELDYFELPGTRIEPWPRG